MRKKTPLTKWSYNIEFLSFKENDYGISQPEMEFQVADQKANESRE